MPISDEVIELAPVKSTKKKLIVMFVIMGVFLAAAVAFLVLYLLKPTPPPETNNVRAVAVTENGLFSTVENAEQKLYASVGNSYTIKVSVSADADANTDIAWYVEPSSALNVTSSVTSGEPSITFTPNMGYHGQEVTVTARAIGNGNISRTVTFTVVNQGTETIVPTMYYRGTESTNAVTLTETEPDIKIPYYAADVNNKQYTLLVEQYGMHDQTTDSHLPLSVIQKDGEYSNALTAKAGDPTVISVTKATSNGVYFRALKSGSTTITITANGNHENAAPVTKTVKVEVSSSAALGYIENVYFFDKAIVDETFMSKYVRGGELNMTALVADYKPNTPNADTGATMNPASITFPYNLKYEDIFKHVLITPVTVQYNTEKKVMNTDWYSRIKVESTNKDVLEVNQNSRTGETSLLARALASTVSGATACKLKFTDSTPAGLKASVDASVNVVASNAGMGKLTVTDEKNNTTEVTSVPVTIVPNGKSVISVVYRLEMPGKTDVKTVIDNGYMTAGFIINYRLDVLFHLVNSLCNLCKTKNRLQR